MGIARVSHANRRNRHSLPINAIRLRHKKFSCLQDLIARMNIAKVGTIKKAIMFNKYRKIRQIVIKYEI